MQTESVQSDPRPLQNAIVSLCGTDTGAMQMAWDELDKSHTFALTSIGWLMYELNPVYDWRSQEDMDQAWATVAHSFVLSPQSLLGEVSSEDSLSLQGILFLLSKCKDHGDTVATVARLLGGSLAIHRHIVPVHCMHKARLLVAESESKGLDWNEIVEQIEYEMPSPMAKLCVQQGAKLDEEFLSRCSFWLYSDHSTQNAYDSVEFMGWAVSRGYVTWQDMSLYAEYHEKEDFVEFCKQRIGGTQKHDIERDRCSVKM